MDLGMKTDYTDSDTESTDDSQENRIAHDSKRLRHVFEPYYKKIFNFSGFIKHMNQRCSGNNDSTSYILLCEAIKRNDNKNAMALLRHYCKANMGKPDPSKDIPLQLAILAGNIDIVEMLLNKGARVNVSFQDHKQSLHLICDKKSSSITDEITRITIAKLLIKHGADINAVEKSKKDTPLILAVRSKYLELAKFLLNNGSNKYYANMHFETAFHVAFSENAGIDMIEIFYDDRFDLYEKDANKHTVFSYAARNLMNSGFGSLCSLSETLKPIQFLLKHGVSVNSILDKRGNKILHMICQNHAAQTMKIFLDHGADVNAKNVDGKTPLHFCTENQSLEFVELLISYGADIQSLTNSGQSVLHFAAANKHTEVLESLLKYGLNVNAKGNESFTPLFYAVWSHRQKNVKLLLDNYANVNERVINDQIVLHVAVDQKKIDVIGILLDHGSDINIVDNYGNTPLTISMFQVTEAIHSDSTDDNCIEMTTSEYIQRILIRHCAKLSLLGQHVSDESLCILNNSYFKEFFEDCISELNEMKESEIIDKINFFDLLTKPRSRLLSFMRNNNFTSALDDSKYKEQFPIYCDNIEQIVTLIKTRLELLNTAEKSLVQLCKNIDDNWVHAHLPTLIIEKILSYLNATDLKNLSLIFESTQ